MPPNTPNAEMWPNWQSSHNDDFAAMDLDAGNDESEETGIPVAGDPEIMGSPEWDDEVDLVGNGYIAPSKSTCLSTFITKCVHKRIRLASS